MTQAKRALKTTWLAGAATLMLGLLLACGEPPTKSAEQANQAKLAPATGAENTPAPVSGLKDQSTTGTQSAMVAMTPQVVDRSALPQDAPKDAEVVTSIKPGVRGGQLVISEAGEPKTFNIVISQDAGSSFIGGLQFSGLTGYDQYEQKDIPGLAKSWEYNPQTREWTFHLREGLKWSDGQPLTADDFLFFTEVIFDPKVPNDENLSFRLEADPKSPRYEFRAPDPLTLVVKIPGVDSFAFLNLGLMRALPRHVLEKPWKEGRFTEVWGANVDPKDLVVSGPYKVKELRKGESLIMERNPYYWRYDTKGQQLPYFDQLVILIVENQDANEVRFFPAGETDLLEGIRPESLARFKDAAAQNNFSVLALGPSLNVNYYYFNLNQGGTYTDAGGQQQVWQPGRRGERPPADLKNFKPFVDSAKMAIFSNPEFRKACSEATDRQTMINSVLFGEGSPLYGTESPSNKVWTNPQIPKFPYNPESAKKRLDKLGLTDRNGDGMREDLQGRPFRFSIVTNRENDTRERIAQQLKDNLASVGLAVDVQVLQFNNLLTKLTSDFDFDCCLLGLSTGVPPHPAMASNTWLSSGRLHAWYPEQKVPATEWEEQLDKMYFSLKRTFDIAEQRKIYFQMQDILAEQQPLITLFNGNVYVAAKNKLGNLKPTVMRNSLTHNLDELYANK